MKRNRWMALALCLSLTLSLLLAGAPSAAASNGSSAVSQARNGVAVVRSFVEIDGTVVDELDGYGTGFFVGKGKAAPEYLITNHHVVSTYLAVDAGQLWQIEDDSGGVHNVRAHIYVYFDKNNYTEAQVVDYSEAADVAILRLAKPAENRTWLTLCSPTTDMQSSQVYAIGFPSLSDNDLMSPTSRWDVDDVTVTTGSLSRLFTESGSMVHRIQTEAVISPGNSGGPLVNAKGQVLGINSATVTSTSVSDSGIDVNKIYYAVNIDEAISLLNRNGIAYTMAGAFPTVWVIAGAAAVVAVIVVVVVLLANKNKKGKKQSGIEKTGGVTPPPPPPPVGSDSGYRIQGVSGALAGQRFMLRTDAPLVLGRDPSRCNVRFPADTAGVSGGHCRVWFQGGKVYIQDVGSSHGTFIQPGTRLSGSQPVALNAGDGFYLGSPQERFVLTLKGGSV